MVLRGRILEKFLLGRQVFVVVVVFMLARITSPTDLTRFMGADLPGWLTSFIATGLVGVIMVVILGQLLPQILAVQYPLQFLNIHIMMWGLYATLVVEATGLVHFTWFASDVFTRWVGVFGRLPAGCCVCHEHFLTAF